MNFPKQNLKRILFVDIETATCASNYGELDDDLKLFWRLRQERYNHKDAYLSEEELWQTFNDKAAIYAEYARVVCISMGVLTSDDEGAEFRVKNLFATEEYDLLTQFADILNAHYYDPFSAFICGHNIREFDIPFLCRRFIINGIPLPSFINITGQKPWQVHHLLDTLDLWKFGDYKHYSSLDLLCKVLSVDSPKGEMSGKDVSGRYWEGHLDEIVKYCEKDVIATARIYLRCIGHQLFTDDQIISVS